MRIEPKLGGLFRLGKSVLNALSHFGRRFAREGHGNN